MPAKRSNQIRIVWLKNHGVRVEQTTGRGMRSLRFVRPDGLLTVPEAVAALGTYEVRLRRMIARKQLRSLKLGGRMMVRLSELRRLRADQSWRQDWRTVNVANERG